ncbi:MAG: hypothetical protein ACYTF0_07630 [Planctomycetota bacterium]|jgi:hypothetical protein
MKNDKTYMSLAILTFIAFGVALAVAYKQYEEYKDPSINQAASATLFQ